MNIGGSQFDSCTFFVFECHIKKKLKIRENLTGMKEGGCLMRVVKGACM